MKTKILLALFFGLVFYVVQSQNIPTNIDQPQSIKTFTGTLESATFTETTKSGNQSTEHTTFGLKLNSNGVKYRLQFEKKTEFINMGRNGNGTFESCDFYKGTYKVSGSVSKQTIHVLKIECLKKSDQSLKILLRSGVFAQDWR
jgi:hypothetical protein